MIFKDLSPDQQKEMAELMFLPLNSATEVKDWARAFLDLELPVEITDLGTSNTTPLDAIWQIYNTFKTNSGNVTPGYILMSCREGMKTVSVAILELLLMLHFSLDIAHGAATETQSAVAIRYINDFVMKIEPLLAIRGWVSMTQNKRTIQYQTPENKTPYIKILICSPKGMNSLHSNVIFLDELDLADPQAIKEAKNITGYSKGIYGVTVYLSTRKYSFGNMQEALDKADEMNYKVLNWNILDVTAACTPDRHKPDLPKQDVFVAKELPLRQLSGEEFNGLADVEKVKYDLLPNVHGGCVGCKLLPVCKTRLSQKPQTATGGFYKPIDAVIQKFRENDPETAMAQLMCWRPGSEGLVYPRFSKSPKDGNVISIRRAYETILGEEAPSSISESALLSIIKNLDYPIYCGVDWGFTNCAVILVMVKIPNGEVWVIDCFSSPGLEFSDILDVAIKMRDKYQPMKWYCDQAMPAYIKSFNKNGCSSPKFTKDVAGGIGAVRSKIMNPMGQRLLRVVETPNTKKVIDAIMKHRFLLDSQGNVTQTPDNDSGTADICDSLRYIGQNMFPVSGPQKPNITSLDSNGKSNIPEDQKFTQEQHEKMAQELAKTIGAPVSKGGNGGRGGFRFTF